MGKIDFDRSAIEFSHNELMVLVDAVLDVGSRWSKAAVDDHDRRRVSLLMKLYRRIYHLYDPMGEAIIPFGKRKPRVARFWWWHEDGWVRLKVREDAEPLHWGTAHLTEEGSHSVFYEWWADDSGVYYRVDAFERDCDGPLSRHGLYRCDWDELDTHLAYDLNGHFSHRTPCWEEVETSQRDEYAERMGY